MSYFLAWLFGRMPIGWLQLRYNPARLFAALAGVAFANILVFMQMGFLGALEETTKFPYRLMDADIFISSSDAHTLSDGSPLPRQRMLQALAAQGVSAASPLYVGKIEWDVPDEDTASLLVMGIDPRQPMINTASINGQIVDLARLGTAILDTRTRHLPKNMLANISNTNPRRIEINGTTVDVIGSVNLGGGFEADGYMIVSAATFLKLFPKRSAGAPSHLLIQAHGISNTGDLVANLQSLLPGSDTQVRTLNAAAKEDERYQTHERPVGIVFGFGIIIGVLVGAIITYQVLSTDVADHIKEYATMKAIGYRQPFFLSIVFEEALVLAFLGFIPGILISLVLYKFVGASTGLPLGMTVLRPPVVLIGTVVMCSISGMIATRKLVAADPADLF